MPEFFLRQANGGKSPEEIFSRVGFSGDHCRTIQLVQSGAFEVGVLDYSVWETDQKAGKVDETKVSVIWEMPTLPRLSMDHPRRRGRELWSRVQGEGSRGASGYRRQGDPGALRPVEIHPGEERRLRTHRRRGESHRSPELISVIPAVSLVNATAGYAGRPVLRGINLTIGAGEKVAVMGRSGAGKSTLLNMIYDANPERVSLIPQAASLVQNLSVFHNVYMGRLDRHSSLYNLRMLVSAARRERRGHSGACRCSWPPGQAFRTCRRALRRPAAAHLDWQGDL